MFWFCSSFAISFVTKILWQKSSNSHEHNGIFYLNVSDMLWEKIVLVVIDIFFTSTLIGNESSVFKKFINKKFRKQFYLLKPNNCRKVIFFLLQLFARGVLVMKKLEIEKTKPTFIISTFKTDIMKVVVWHFLESFFEVYTTLFLI